MNEFWASIVLAIVQGFTEWFPVSSKGHLILFEKILGFNGGLEFDVVLHFGTLAAVFVYFGKDIVDITGELLKGRFHTPNGKLGILILIATVPAALVGFFFKDIFASAFQSLALTACGFAVTGILLIVASLPNEKFSKQEFGWKGALIVGIAQVFALFPGISRSGTTTSAGLLAGLDEKSALKFSFLMSIPIIFGANILVIGNNPLSKELVYATFVSFIVGLISIYLLYNYVLSDKKNLRWFAYYVLALSAAIFTYLIFF